MKKFKIKNYKTLDKKRTRRALMSTIIFDKKIAQGFSKPEYYRVLGEDIRNLPSREKEKQRFATPRSSRVTKLIEGYKALLKKKSGGIFNVLKGIYDTNTNIAKTGGSPPVHTNLLSLVASIPVLITSYAKIRKNKGATTLGAMLSYSRLRKANPLQRRLLSNTANAPDGLNYQVFACTVKLLKQGRYPWGASRRVYMTKPGQPGKLRPITIPPFMDRVVQAAILRILESIYEPWFELQNRSFGFRTRKGVHDAIYALTRQENKGLHTAIEGDIKGAYDNVNRQKLLEILGKRINDRKFLKLIEDRLDYQFLDVLSNKYVSEDKGIPQGGIDSPYLWNIYMSEFDDHIHRYMDDLVSNLNKKIRKNSAPRTRIPLKRQSQLSNKRRSLKEDLQLLKTYDTLEKYKIASAYSAPKSQSVRKRLSKFYVDTNLVSTPEGMKVDPQEVYKIVREIRLIGHKLRRLPGSDPNKKYLRYIYIRYADDWILLGNYPKLLAVQIKEHISQWLKDNLNAQLAEEKTLITDIRKPDTPAHFLGFELRSYNTRKLMKKVVTNNRQNSLRISKVAGSEITAFPDQQRLISRLHMKGYCDKRGNPRPISWLSTLETFALIERFNSVLLGFGNFYHGFVAPSTLNRWIYIIRFSCFKTLAQKYDTNIKGIFSKFGVRTKTGNTITYTVNNTFTVDGVTKTMQKKWSLYTEKDIQNLSLANDRYSITKQRFNKIEYDHEIPNYESTGSSLSIKDDDWVNKIMWVNLRTSASFDLPCSLCGSLQNIHMHHIKHIRKVLYSDLKKANKPWLCIMALRNRRQIPVCRECHLNVIHKGTYMGANLKTLVPQGNEMTGGYDNRLINIENYINPSLKEYFAESLEEKGWKEIQQKRISRDGELLHEEE